MADLKDFTDISDNVVDSFNNLTGKAKGGTPVSPYFPLVESVIESSSWQKLPFPYTFSIYDVFNGVFAGEKNGVEEFTEFPLPLAPSNLSQSEDFAISIRPTQGGTVVTHSGNRYKTLVLKGTTGVSPFRGAGGVLPSTGEAIFQPKQLKYKSGYEVFLRLRNWLRDYYEYKARSPKKSKDLRLVFKNFKDGEFLIVECVKFNMVRQAGRPFLYDYELEFRVLAPLFGGAELIKKLKGETSRWADALEKLTLAQGVLLRVGDILRQIEGAIDTNLLAPLRKVNLILKTVIAIPSVAADIGNRIINETVSSVQAIGITLGIKNDQVQNRVLGTLDPRLADVKLPANVEAVVKVEGASFLNSLGEGLMALEASKFPQASLDALAEETAALGETPRAFYEGLREEFIRVKQNAEDAFNLGSAALDAIFGRTSTSKVDPNKVASPDELSILNGLNAGIQGLDILLSTEGLFKSSYEARLAQLSENFETPLGLQATLAVEQKVYTGGTTLERLALNFLGDSTRWGEIAELNNLRAPYVVSELDSVLEGVLKPGDRYLIPTDTTQGFDPLPTTKETSLNKGLSAVEKSLGTDFRLTEEFDLALTPSQDIALVSSIDNIIQAVKVRLGYEKGDVMGFPQIGVGIGIGNKFPSVFEIQRDLISTLLQDSRIEQVTDLSLERKGSELQLTFDLKIKQVDTPIPLIIKLST